MTWLLNPSLVLGASQIALCSLLNSFLDQPVSSVQVINTELTSEVHQKRPRMDLLAELEDGRLANIEMQIVHDKEELLYRMMYYLIRLSSRQRLKEGQPYSHLKNTYQIFIAGFYREPTNFTTDRTNRDAQ